MLFELRSPHRIMAKALDCNFKMSLNPSHAVVFTFGKGMNLFVSPAKEEIVSLLLFYKDCFRIKYPMKVDI